MKYVAVFMVVLVLLAGAVGVYAYLNVKLEVASIEMAAYPATQQAADFQGWQNAVDNGAVSGTAFTGSIPGTADDYSYFVYTLRLRNKGLLMRKWWRCSLCLSMAMCCPIPPRTPLPSTTIPLLRPAANATCGT